jgi:hypothetical protein
MAQLRQTALFCYLARQKRPDMRPKLILVFCISLASLPLLAQPSRAVLHWEPRFIASQYWMRATLEVPLEEVEPFLAFSLAWRGEAAHFQARFSPDGREWAPWLELHLDGHAEQSPARYVSELVYADADTRYVELRVRGAAVTAVEAHFYNPGRTADLSGEPTAPIELRDPQVCPCPQPAFQNRAAWCPAGNCPPNPNPTPTTVTHLIVHHSAGTNAATDWAAIVRAIWDFHVNVNGWADIGYNWLIDPNGVLYEGRGDNRLGAHFCGTNSGTMGACVLGDFTTLFPQEAALSTLIELLSWKICDIGADPLGTAFHASSGLTLNRISGHRDGCATQCPGNTFYPFLPSIRLDVTDYIALSCADIAPPSNLRATVVSETQIDLEWEDRSDNENAFLIERALALNGPYAQIASVGTNVTTYADMGLTPHTAYYYQVRAVNEQDTSVYSNRAFAVTTLTSAREAFAGRELKLFPNPAREVLTLSLDAPLSQEVQLRLFNPAAQLVWEGRLESGQAALPIPLHGLPAGLYALRLSNGEAVAAYRVVKE